MIKQTLFISTLLLSFVNVDAQNSIKKIDFEISSPYPVVDGYTKKYFTRGAELMAVKIRGRFVVIQKMNASTMSYLQEQSYEDFPKVYEADDILEVGNRFYFFYSVTDLKAKIERLYMREIDFNKGAFKGEAVLLIETGKEILGSKIWKTFDLIKFRYSQPLDNSSLCISYTLKPQNKDQGKNHVIKNFCVYDSSMAMTWTKEVIMPFTENKMRIRAYTMDDKGNVYFLSKTYKDDGIMERVVKNGPPNYDLEVYKISQGNSDLTKKVLDLKENFLSSASIYFAGGNIYVAGYFCDGNDNWNVDGVFSFKVIESEDKPTGKFYKIPIDVLNQYVGEKQLKKNEKQEDELDFSRLELRNFELREDGSIILVGEQSFWVQRESSSNGHVTSIYNANDMLITKIDPDGSLAWMRKLPKRQFGGAQGSLSFKYDYNTKLNTHFLFFLDNEKNENLSVSERPEYYNDGIGGTTGMFTCFMVDDMTGAVSRSSILSMKDAKDGLALKQFRTGRIIPNDEGDYLVEFYKGEKQDVLIKLDVVK